MLTFMLIAHAELGEGASGIITGRAGVYLKNNYLSFCVWNISVLTHHNTKVAIAFYLIKFM